MVRREEQSEIIGVWDGEGPCGVGPAPSNFLLETPITFCFFESHALVFFLHRRSDTHLHTRRRLRGHSTLYLSRNASRASTGIAVVHGKSSHDTTRPIRSSVTSSNSGSISGRCAAPRGSALTSARNLLAGTEEEGKCARGERPREGAAW
jgi:hypothetical protein